PLLHRRAGVRITGDGVVQLGRAARAHYDQNDAAESARTKFLEAARPLPRQNSTGNLQLRDVDHLGGRDRREPASVRVQLRQPARLRRRSAGEDGANVGSAFKPDAFGSPERATMGDGTPRARGSRGSSDTPRTASSSAGTAPRLPRGAPRRSARWSTAGAD